MYAPNFVQGVAEVIWWGNRGYVQKVNSSANKNRVSYNIHHYVVAKHVRQRRFQERRGESYIDLKTYAASKHQANLDNEDRH